MRYTLLCCQVHTVELIELDNVGKLKYGAEVRLLFDVNQQDKLMTYNRHGRRASHIFRLTSRLQLSTTQTLVQTQW